MKKIIIIPLILIYFTFCLFASFTHIHSECEKHHTLSIEYHYEHSIFCELFHGHINETENADSKDYRLNEQYSSSRTINHSAHYPYRYESSIQVFQTYSLKLKLKVKNINNFINSPELPPPKPLIFSRTFINLQGLIVQKLDISKSSGLSPPNFLC